MDPFAFRAPRGRLQRRVLCRAALGLVLGAPAASAPLLAADLSVRDIVLAIAGASADRPADFSGRDLRGLDLSDIDFRGARLARADLTTADLSDAVLAGSDLAEARLDLAVVIRTNFAGARLAKASLTHLASATGFISRPDEAPNFSGADLSGATIFAHLAFCDFSGARLVGAHLAIGERAPRTLNLTHTDLSSSNLSGADLRRADLRGIDLRFANLRGADLAEADLRHADLTQADLTGAVLAGAELADADLDEAVLRAARGLDSVRGLAESRHRERIVW